MPTTPKNERYVPTSPDVDRVAKALFMSRPVKVRGALTWGRMDAADKRDWQALAIAALDMTHGAQIRGR